jgi:hypothetical protein
MFEEIRTTWFAYSIREWMIKRLREHERNMYKKKTREKG